MTQFLKVGSLGYHIEGGYINEQVDKYEVRISSTFSDSRDPEGKRKLVQLILSDAELEALIYSLNDILDSQRQLP